MNNLLSFIDRKNTSPKMMFRFSLKAIEKYQKEWGLKGTLFCLIERAQAMDLHVHKKSQIRTTC
jgi:hypothetical protein